jgi:hypothetical protein
MPICKDLQTQKNKVAEVLVPGWARNCGYVQKLADPWQRDGLVRLRRSR